MTLTMSASGLPIFSGDVASDPLSLRDARDDIVAALREFSFIVLRVLPRDRRITSAATSAWQEFFANGRGSTLKKLGCADRRHQFHSSAADCRGAALAAGGDAALCDATGALVAMLADRARAIFTSIRGDGIDLSSGEDAASVFDTWHYFGVAGAGAVVCGDHVDPGIFTVEPCAGCYPGLQIYHPPSSSWIDVEAKLDATSDVIFFAGAQLAAQCSGVAAARHRVLDCGGPRLSLAYELRLSGGGRVEWNG